MPLQNPGFEADWGEESSHACLVIPEGGAPYEADIGNINTPPEWLTWFHHNPGTWDQPEVRDAWGHDDERRARSGEKGILLFTFSRKHDAGFLQQVSVSPGDTLRLTAYAHAWSNHKDNSIPGRFPHPDDPWWCEGAGWAPRDKDHIPIGAKNWYLDGDTDSSDWRNFTFWVGIDPTGGINPLADTVVWGQGIHQYNEYVEPIPAVEIEAQADTITVFLRSRTLWPFKHNDAYWDDTELTVVGDQQLTADFTCACNGLICIFDASSSEGVITRYHWDFGDDWHGEGETVGHTYDDAGTYTVTLVVSDVAGNTATVSQSVTVSETLPPPDECRITILLPYLEIIRDTLDDMIEEIEEGQPPPPQNQPPNVNAGPDQTVVLPAAASLDGTVTDDGLPDLPGIVITGWSQVSGTGMVTFTDASATDTTASFSEAGTYALRLTADDGELTAYDDVAMTVQDEPPPIEETRVGLHLQGGEPGVSEYYNATQSGILKTFWLQGYELLGGSPNTHFVFRQYVSHPGQYLWHSGGVEAGATAFIETFRSSLLTEADRSPRPIFAESLNEEYSHDQRHIEQSIAFDSAFVRILSALHPNVRAVVFNAPVGNPHESQFELLVPLAELVMQYDGAFGYHSYWGANPGNTYLESWWPWLAGRFTEIDKVLNANGVYGMRWLMGEGGGVGAWVTSGMTYRQRAAVNLISVSQRRFSRSFMANMKRRAQPLFDGQRFEVITRPRLIARADRADQSESIILLPDSGWKNRDCYDGDWGRYEGDIVLYQSLIQGYNAGMTLFTTNGPGWGSFNIGQAEMEKLAQVL